MKQEIEIMQLGKGGKVSLGGLRPPNPPGSETFQEGTAELGHPYPMPCRHLHSNYAQKPQDLLLNAANPQLVRTPNL